MKATSNTSLPGVLIRPLESSDNALIAKIIRNALLEHGAAKPGTAYYDESTDAMSEAFNIENSAYFIAESHEIVAGGAGIYPTEGLPEGVCELVKMYLSPAFRGQGIARALLDKTLEFARQKGYRSVYLESMPELGRAVAVYEKMGFQQLDAPMGNTGHFDCSIWMLKSLI